MIKIASRNLYRKKLRTIILLFGIGIAVTGFVGLMSFSSSIKTTFHESLESIQGIIVMQKGALDYPFSTIDEKDADKIERIKSVSLVVPQISGMVSEVDGEKIPFSLEAAVSFVGEDPEKAEEEKTGMFKHNVVLGRYLKPGDRNAAVIGKKIADDYKKKIGSRIEINRRSFRVVGIYSSGTDLMDTMVIIPLDQAREMAGLPEGKVNGFYVEVEDPKKASAIAGVIEDIFPEYDAASSSDYAEELGTVLSQIDTFFLAVAGIAILIGGIGILNTIMMSVAERRKEFGILRAMGWTDDNVMWLVVEESFLLGLSGGVLGMIMSYASVKAASAVMPFKIIADPTVFAWGFCIAVLLGILGGAYPAWRASRLEPVIAMKD